MYIKIYFNNKPMFLCNEIDPAIEPYLHHDDAVFIDDFSSQAVKAMIHEMELPKIHAGIFLHQNMDELKKAFWKKFIIVQAAGGLVTNTAGEVLIIFRRGKWDLPKGKLDKGETLDQCALREVSEETGLQNIQLQEFLMATYHTYHENGHFILKESHWYNMTTSDKQKLVPQTAEEISEARWVQPSAINELLNNTFPSVQDVLVAAGKTTL